MRGHFQVEPGLIPRCAEDAVGDTGGLKQGIKRNDPSFLNLDRKAFLMWMKELLFGGPGGATKLADAGLLILRVFTGLSMAIAHGLGKVKNPSQIIGGVRKMELPVPELLGYAAIGAEFLGALFIAIGLFCRPAAAALACTMAVAAFVAHGSDPYGKKELALLYLVISLTLLFTGAGRFSIDRLIRK